MCVYLREPRQPGFVFFAPVVLALVPPTLDPQLFIWTPAPTSDLSKWVSNLSQLPEGPTMLPPSGPRGEFNGKPSFILLFNFFFF